MVFTLFGHTKAKRNSHVWLQCAKRTVLGLVIGTVLLLTVQQRFAVSLVDTLLLFCRQKEGC